ncbi:MAG: D-tagatose-bisphosphate aldolase, class II, non-catalytic subunit [Acidimicrobiales bacterium]
MDALRSRRGGVVLRRLATWLNAIAPGHKAAGITSVCSAHPMVIEAAMLEAASLGNPVLVEATCNQVNHQGGYTGLTPASFRDLVYSIADRTSFPRHRVMLGGDHLGPNPWRHLPVEQAMAQAESMVAAYVDAGFEKIHLDTSMGCQGEPSYVPAPLTAERAARLAVVAQKVGAAQASRLRFVIGTEVPAPGGAKQEIAGLEVTRPEAVIATLEAHRKAFAEAGAQEAYEAVMAIVAQPGVEFDEKRVVVYQPELAVELQSALTHMPGLVFEAHSTDYQPPDKLAQLVHDGFAILKVGPGLTFALRQALYGLDHIASELDHDWAEHGLVAEMEEIMLASPKHWQPYYQGDASQQRWLRHFSYSDRIRYYWAYPRARQAVERLLGYLSDKSIPEPLISEFLPTLYPRVVNGLLAPRPRELLLAAVRDVLRAYADACKPLQAV